MLLLFLEEVQQSFDLETSMILWKSCFTVVNIILVVIIPLALLRDFICSKTRDVKKRKFKNRMVSGLACCMFATIFLVDAFIFNTYIEVPKMVTPLN